MSTSDINSKRVLGKRKNYLESDDEGRDSVTKRQKKGAATIPKFNDQFKSFSKTLISNFDDQETFVKVKIIDSVSQMLQSESKLLASCIMRQASALIDQMVPIFDS